jgi:hypothetical protein
MRPKRSMVPLPSPELIVEMCNMRAGKHYPSPHVTLAMKLHLLTFSAYGPSWLGYAEQLGRRLTPARGGMRHPSRSEITHTMSST